MRVTFLSHLKRNSTYCDNICTDDDVIDIMIRRISNANKEYDKGDKVNEDDYDVAKYTNDTNSHDDDENMNTDNDDNNNNSYNDGNDKRVMITVIIIAVMIVKLHINNNTSA